MYSPANKPSRKFFSLKSTPHQRGYDLYYLFLLLLGNIYFPIKPGVLNNTFTVPWLQGAYLPLYQLCLRKMHPK